MSTLPIQLPESLARQLRECAASEGVTMDQLLAAAAGKKLSALLTIDPRRQRAAQGKREGYAAFLADSPNVPPMPGDEKEDGFCGCPKRGLSGWRKRRVSGRRRR